MNLFDIAFKNIKRNFYNYFVYFVSIVFNVMIYYTFASIRFNKQVESLAEGSMKIGVGFKVASIIIAIFAVIFIWYSTSFFIKKRKKEIGLYSLLGIKKNQVGRMLFYENIVMGVLALFVGIVLGTLLSKLFVMILINLMGIHIGVQFAISIKAILDTMKVFGILFLITSIHGYTIVYRYKLIELFSAESKAEKEPKVSIILSILSIVMIIVGYIVGLNVKQANFLMSISITFVSVVIGTFIFFNSFLAYVIKMQKENKRKYYSGINMVGISHLLYRIKGNARTLSIIAVLSATTITAVGFSYSVKYMFDKMEKEQYPFSLSYVTTDRLIDKKVESIIDKYPNNKILNSLDIELVKVDGKGQIASNFAAATKDKSIYIISKSMFNKISKMKSIKVNSLINLDNEVIILQSRKNETEKYNGKIISVQSQNIKSDFVIKEWIPLSTMNGGQLDPTLVVKDEVYNKYYANGEIVRQKGYIIDNQSDSKDLTKEIIRNMPAKVDLSSFYQGFSTISMVTGIFMFIGLFTGLVFLISTGSIIYFKQLIEADDDKRRYLVLRNIGVNRAEIKTSIAKQLLMVFGAPLILGIAHSCVALGMMGKLLEADVFVPTVMTIVVYTIIYLVYYVLCLNSYNRIVNSSK